MSTPKIVGSIQLRYESAVAGNAIVTGSNGGNFFIPVDSGWLSVLSEELRSRLIGTCKPREANKGESLWHFGDDPDGLYYILSGCLRAETEQFDRDPSMLTIFHTGSWIGEAEIVAGTSRITTMSALRDCDFRFLPKTHLLDLAKKFPELWRGLGYLASKHLYIAVAGLYDMMLRSSSDRLAGILLRISGARVPEFSGPTNLSLDVTQNELAQMCNVSRSVVSGLLDEFAREGVVELRYGQVTVLDLASLANKIGVEISD